jgi:hypothetical protein
MDQLVVVNPSFIDDLVEYGISRDKITYLPNFVNRDQWHPLSTEEVQDVRKHYAISPDQFVVLGAGQVQRRKGIDDFAQLARECPDVTFVWAGGFSFGNMTNGHAEYKKLMENQIRFESSEGGKCEGFIARPAKRFHLEDFRKKVGKYVRKGHVQTDIHWRNNWKKAKLKLSTCFNPLYGLSNEEIASLVATIVPAKDEEG